MLIKANINGKIMKKILTMALLVLSQATVADWTLNNAHSSLNFISTKNSTVTEVHHFKSLQGGLTDTGVATLSVDLNSVETNVPIRNQRMNEFLFNTVKFPTANVKLTIDSAKISNLVAGDSTTISSEAVVNLHGISQQITTTLKVVALKSGGLQVSSLQPIILNPAKFDLLVGIQKLQALAKLTSITSTVPVSFNFVFDKVIVK